MLQDRVAAWSREADGSYTRFTPRDGADPASPEAMGTLQTLMNLAAEASTTPSP